MPADAVRRIGEIDEEVEHAAQRQHEPERRQRRDRSRADRQNDTGDRPMTTGAETEERDPEDAVRGLRVETERQQLSAGVDVSERVSEEQCGEHRRSGSRGARHDSAPPTLTQDAPAGVGRAHAGQHACNETVLNSMHAPRKPADQQEYRRPADVAGLVQARTADSPSR